MYYLGRWRKEGKVDNIKIGDKWQKTLYNFIPLKNHRVILKYAQFFCGNECNL